MSRGKTSAVYIADVNNPRSCEEANIRAQLVGTEHFKAYERKHGENGCPLYASLGFRRCGGGEDSLGDELKRIRLEGPIQAFASWRHGVAQRCGETEWGWTEGWSIQKGCELLRSGSGRFYRA